MLRCDSTLSTALQIYIYIYIYIYVYVSAKKLVQHLDDVNNVLIPVVIEIRVHHLIPDFKSPTS